MGKGMRAVAQEIGRSLALELAGRQEVTAITSDAVLDPLIEHLADAVATQLSRASASPRSSDEDLEARLQKVEKKLEKLAISERDTDEDEMVGAGSSFPNLKYGRPKYKNVESILKYVDGEDGKGAVKLVIMNFND